MARSFVAKLPTSKPRRRRGSFSPSEPPHVVQRPLTERELKQLKFERDLLRAACRLHADGAVCDRCPARYRSDGYGFPHPTQAGGRLRLRVCHSCNKLMTIAEFDRDSYPAHVRCLACKAKADGSSSTEDR